MIRIVGIQRHPDPEREFILFQNQGSLRHLLKGHVVMGQDAIDGADLSSVGHLFRDDVYIPPGMYVLLTTGCGDPRWARTKDGAMVFYAYMGRSRSVWDRSSASVHVLCTQHTFVERTPTFALK